MFTFANNLQHASEVPNFDNSYSLVQVIQTVIQYCKTYKWSSYNKVVFGQDSDPETEINRSRFHAIYNRIAANDVPDGDLLCRMNLNRAHQCFICGVFVKCYDAEVFRPSSTHADQRQRERDLDMDMVLSYDSLKYSGHNDMWKYQLAVDAAELETFPGALLIPEDPHARIVEHVDLSDDDLDDERYENENWDVAGDENGDGDSDLEPVQGTDEEDVVSPQE